MLGDEKDSNNTPVEGSALASKGGENGYRGEQRTRRRVCCDHCNKLGHTKDKCWLLHENLPIGGLDRVMEGAFKLQQMQEQPLKGKNPQPLKYHLAKEQMDMSYKLLNQSQQPNTNVRSCNLAQTKLHSRKAIDNAKVHEGLYFFGDEDSRTRQPLAFGFKSISVSDDEIML
ncbi:hypothetical protein CK203_076682 [Vitis vinifera]|uniref:Uncharacterized protein n=1 Tax=Vitis vinifera TaxID=29760 RepID=A0A438EPQ1_VITVI|nr:hypothetical protein CK203_076682 [Vitis vinifera]